MTDLNQWITECEPVFDDVRDIPAGDPLPVTWVDVFDDDGNSVRMPVEARYSDGQTTTLDCPAVHVERLTDGILADLEAMIREAQ